MKFSASRCASVCAALGTLLFGGCAYYNGIYNARHALERADALSRAGRYDSAAVLYARAADAAESVLRRRNETTWRSEALLLAGRARSMSGECAIGSERLTDYLSQEVATASENRIRAELALAQCEAREERFASAGARLAALDSNATLLNNARLQQDVRRLRARVALASGQNDLADTLLASFGERDAPWELISFSIARGDWVRAEALLSERAQQGDAHPSLEGLLSDASRLGHSDFAARVVQQYESSASPRDVRARLLLLAGELALEQGDTLGGRAHFTRVIERLESDTLRVRTAQARLVQLDVAAADSADQLRRVLYAARPLARGDALFDRIEQSTALFLILHDTDDASGAARFLAGEVARDSLGAPRLALHTWRSLASERPDSPLTPRALYAAVLLNSDSANLLRTEIEARYPTSGMSSLLRGEGISSMVEQRAADDLLDGRWAIATLALADTLRAWRAVSAEGALSRP